MLLDLFLYRLVRKVIRPTSRIICSSKSYGDARGNYGSVGSKNHTNRKRQKHSFLLHHTTTITVASEEKERENTWKKARSKNFFQNTFHIFQKTYSKRYYTFLKAYLKILFWNICSKIYLMHSKFLFLKILL